MIRRTAAAHIPLHIRLYGTIGKRIISAKLKPLTLNLTSREIADPVVMSVPTRHGHVRCFIYRPHPDAPLSRGGVLPPVHINIHGGGFILTNPRQDEHVVKYLAAEVGVAIVNIDYGTAPEVQFPVAEEQCFDVLTWVANSGAEQGWDAERISIGGGSAGGKLSINALQLARQAGGPTVRAAALVVPCVDVSLPAESFQSEKTKPDIDAATIRIIQRTYFADAATRVDVLGSPILDPDLIKAMPPTVVLGAEYDTLRPQVERLVHRLENEGGSVVYRRFDGTDHSFLGVPETPSTVIRESVQLIGTHLLRHLAADDDRDASRTPQ